MPESQRRIPRSFSFRKEVLDQLDQQILIGARSRWVESLVESELGGNKKPDKSGKA